MRKLKLDELGRMDVREFRKAPKMPFLVILDNIRSLNNIGSVFRTADALAVEKIYLTGFTAVPPHKDIHKTALGATESVAWEHRPDITELLTELGQRKIIRIAVEQTDRSIPLPDFRPPAGTRLALIFGNEVRGVSDSALPLVDLALEIPQFGTKHSFNVAVSAGIVLWDLTAKLKYYGS